MSSPSGKTYIRYAPYVEHQHRVFLEKVAECRDNVIDDSPFSDYDDLEINNAFLGTGLLLSDYQSLYEMYGQYMSGLDIDELYNQLFDKTINSTEVNNLVIAEAALMEDDIDSNALPRMQTGMRDINSVMTSSFVLGKTLIEDTRVKVLEKFRAELKYKLIPIVSSRWIAQLDWNKNLVCTYGELLKFYLSAKIDADEVNYSFAAKERLWPFTVLEYQRAALGAMQGATTTTTNAAGASTASKVIGGALSGASTGAMIGGTLYPAVEATKTTAGSAGGAGWGAAGGAALGVAAALTY